MVTCEVTVANSFEQINEFKTWTKLWDTNDTGNDRNENNFTTERPIHPNGIRKWELPLPTKIRTEHYNNRRGWSSCNRRVPNIFTCTMFCLWDSKTLFASSSQDED